MSASIDPDTPVSDGGPDMTTSSPAIPSGGADSPHQPPPATSPGSPAAFFPGADGQTYYTNTTLDDFSPLVRFSNVETDWFTPLSEPATGDKPTSDRSWYLATYRRTLTVNATVTIDFWGSGINLFGDSGPQYGNFSVAIDGGAPTIHTAFYPAQAAGRAHHVFSVGNLTEGRHNLTVTNLGSIDDFSGDAWLLDYATVTQKVGVPGRLFPKAFDFRRSELVNAVTTNGTWTLLTFQDDVPPVRGTAKPEIYLERAAYTTTDNFATLTHSFKGTGIQVFGGRNVTHGSYRVTLASTNSSEVLHTAVYNAAMACDIPGETSNSPFRCAWRGSALKFSAADLNPDLTYELQLQNLHNGNASSVFEIDLIRVIDLQDTREPGLPDEDEESGALLLGAANPFTNLLMFFMTFLFVWKSFKH